MPPTRVPVAVIGYGCKDLTCSFGGSGSFDTSANIISYNWDFGDGETGAGPKTTHTYAVPGTYSVTLTVTDENHVSGSSVRSVTVTSPPPPVPIPPSVAIVVPASGAAFAAPATVGIAATASDQDGTIASVRFYFGSSLMGTATDAPYTVTSSALSPGSYTLTAVATDNAGLSTTSGSVTIRVLVTPSASFTYACIRLTCTFNGSSSQGDMTSYAWDFGDHTGVYSGTVVTHTYTRAGTYAVASTVANAIGSSTTSQGVTVVPRPGQAIKPALARIFHTDSTRRT